MSTRGSRDETIVGTDRKGRAQINEACLLKMH